MPGDIYDIPVVLSTTDRGTQFPTPAANQRVENLGTANIERYNGTTWVTDFLGVNTVGLYNIKAFGALGNGTNDDAAAVRAAVAAAVAAGGGTVFVPAGTWTIKTTIDCTNAVGVTICGVGLSSIFACTTGDALVATTTKRCALRDLRITTSATSNVNGLLFAQAAQSFVVDSVRFEGGGISLNTCSYSTISNTTHNGLQAAGSCIYMFQCTSCTIVNPIVEPFIMPASAAKALRLIEVSFCKNVSVVGGSITSVDLTQVTSGGGIGFTASNYCTLTGMTVFGLLGADGIVVEGVFVGPPPTPPILMPSTYITISNCISSNNDPGAGHAGQPSYGVGDGFDLFNSNHLSLDNCVAQANGLYSGHFGFEIDTCQAVDMTNCVATGNSAHGIQLGSTSDALLIGCVSSANNSGGLFALIYDAGPDCTNVRVIGGDYSGNHANGAGTPPLFSLSGIYLGNSTTATLIGVRATDPKATKTQQYGIYVANTSIATVIGCQTAGNGTAGLVKNVAAGGAVTAALNDSNSATIAVTGAKAGNAALANLLTALATLNIITDSTT